MSTGSGVKCHFVLFLNVLCVTLVNSPKSLSRSLFKKKKKEKA